ncbi:MAG: hypothetical protein GY772_25765 [bacterium]|nr:hypothetical protein [bacterium]
MKTQPPSRPQVFGAVALLLVSLAAFAAFAGLNPAVPFLAQERTAPWIGFPDPPDGMLGLAPRNDPPVTHFARSFDAPPLGKDGARLRVRALRELRVWIDDEPLPLPTTGHWRRERTLDVSDRLAPGPHEIRVAVTNPTGPALLSLRLEGLPTPLISDESWRVERPGSERRRAIRIGPERVNPGGFAMPSPAEGLAERRGIVLAALACGALLLLVLHGRPSNPWIVGLVPVAITALWLGPVLWNALAIPIDVGFDARHHVAYVNFLRDHGALPIATDGWSMFHPPVYYGATAGLLSLSGGAPLGWKLVGVVSGLASAPLVAWLAVSLFGRGGREAAYTTLLAGTLPMNVYVSSYVTNESLHAALATAIVVATCRILLADSTRLPTLLAWAVLVAAAVLTKYTAWIVASVAGFFLVAKWWRIESSGGAELSRRIALTAGTVLALAGWFTVRGFLTTGQLFPLNVDLPGETQQWWAQPGYYTPAFLFHFGSVLTHPFLSGTHSAWDAFYSTLWGDGQLAGQMLAALRHPHWDWELMAAGYGLALPATLLIGFGGIRAARTAFRDADPRVRAVHSFLLTLAWALLLSVLAMTLRQQDYGMAKAFYALAAMAPLCVFFGMGAATADRWLEARLGVPGRAIFFAWLAAFAATTFGPYLV